MIMRFRVMMIIGLFTLALRHLPTGVAVGVSWPSGRQAKYGRSPKRGDAAEPQHALITEFSTVASLGCVIFRY